MEQSIANLYQLEISDNFHHFSSCLLGQSVQNKNFNHSQYYTIIPQASKEFWACFGIYTCKYDLDAAAGVNKH